MSRPTYFTLFSGGDGAGVGLSAAGYDHLGGVEYDPQIAAVAATNGHPLTVADIRTVDPLDYAHGAPTWLHASPVCKSFSQAKTDGVETTADIEMAQATCTFIRAWQPPIVSIENVWQYRDSASFKCITDCLTECGYSFDYWHLNSANYGVPQTRKRRQPAIQKVSSSMRVGTKSLLFGAHQFILYPLFLAVAWTKLYGLPLDPRLWIAFIVHDWGYFGRENMDGDKGQRHPELGGKIMARLFGQDWGDFCRLHSRYYAKLEGREPSPLCAADKLVLLVTPRWIYLPAVRATGEVQEYTALYAAWRGVESVTIEEWYDGLRANWLTEVYRLAPHTAFTRKGHADATQAR